MTKYNRKMVISMQENCQFIQCFMIEYSFIFENFFLHKDTPNKMRGIRENGHGKSLSLRQMAIMEPSSAFFPPFFSLFFFLSFLSFFLLFSSLSCLVLSSSFFCGKICLIGCPEKYDRTGRWRETERSCGRATVLLHLVEILNNPSTVRFLFYSIENKAREKRDANTIIRGGRPPSHGAKAIQRPLCCFLAFV